MFRTFWDLYLFIISTLPLVLFLVLVLICAASDVRNVLSVTFFALSDPPDDGVVAQVGVGTVGQALADFEAIPPPHLGGPPGPLLLEIVQHGEFYEALRSVASIEGRPESDVASVLALYDKEVGVFLNVLLGWVDVVRYEGVVLTVDDEERRLNLAEVLRGGRSLVVFVNAAVAEPVDGEVGVEAACEERSGAK